ncbi:MAG: membrane protein insertase YidC [Sphingomonadales bacterium]
MSDQKNMVLAILLSVLVLYVYQIMYVEPQVEAERQAQILLKTSEENLSSIPTPSGDIPTPRENQIQTNEDTLVLVPSPRINIQTPSLKGSIALRGGRVDDLVLVNYFNKLGEDAQNIVLLKPSDQKDGYYAEFGWAAAPSSGVKTPNDQSMWTADRGELTPGNPVTLQWENGEGLIFRRLIEIDESFMIQITEEVYNNTTDSVTLAPYGLISRKTTPETSGFVILHEGPLGVFQEGLEEVSYEDLKDDGNVEFNSTGGWLGITDKYWMTALVPDQTDNFDARFLTKKSQGDDSYQIDYLAQTKTIQANSKANIQVNLFAGAKEVRLIDGYEKEFGIKLFDRTIDWGMLYFLTKPMFYVLDFFFGLLGNFGLAILALTVVVKAIFYPLANKSYVSMSKMKLLQPKMAALKEKYGDDKLKFQQATMEMYKKEKVNPAAGCLPILVQLPVFFALYKTLFVSIEMRHQPFFGWVKDLSAPDNLTFITGFGAFPWDAPGFLLIGVWPILMGVTMYLQQKLNPQVADPIQAKIFMFMPILFTFILASFPVGLVIYWTWNNILTILQQGMIMKRVGAQASNDN